MELRNLGAVVLAGMMLTGGAMVAPAQDDSTTKSDNTKTNKQDRGGATATADNQKNNKSDRELTREIRKAITADKSLSTYAHNVKVVSQSGTVTLRGPVRSDDEKRTIEQKAADVAGASNVKNELTVVSADAAKKP
jgi:hyperosmotically inducible periplasmic protein